MFSRIQSWFENLKIKRAEREDVHDGVSHIFSSAENTFKLKYPERNLWPKESGVSIAFINEKPRFMITLLDGEKGPENETWWLVDESGGSAKELTEKEAQEFMEQAISS
jgi:hypothetical protein